MLAKIRQTGFGWLISIGASIILTVILDLSKITSVYWAIVAGLVLELIATLHTIGNRLDSVEHMLGKARGFPSLLSAIDNVFAMDVDKRRFKQLLLRREVDIFCSTVDQLQRGRQGVSPDYFMRLAEAIFGELGGGDVLFATSVFGGGEYWRTRFGHRYTELNKNAHTRGVKIIRTYIMHDLERASQKLSVMQAQAAFSEVNVLLLSESNLEDSDLLDMFVVGEGLAVEFHFQSDIITHIDVVTDISEVARLTKAMKKIVSASRPLSYISSLKS